MTVDEVLLEDDGTPYTIEHTFKLSFPQWEDLANGKKPEVQNGYYFPDRFCVVTRRYSSSNIDVALVERDLTERVEKPDPDPLYGSRGHKVREQVLTDLGLVVMDALPKCPDRKTWPETKTSEKKARSAENIRLTGPQQRMLNEWAQIRPTEAMPVGGSNVEKSRWRHPSHIPSASLTCLLQMELVEPGIQGVKMVGGKLVFDDNRHPGVELVYRMTVVGGLLAQSDD